MARCPGVLVSVLAVLGLLLLPVAGAHAITGDPLPQPVSPVDGAAVAANDAGVQLTFTCPAYRTSPAVEEATTDLAGYAARISRDPSGANGFASASVQRSATDPSQCTALVRDTATASPLQTTPGTSYWFVDRTCFCGNGADTEAGPVASFTIRAAVAKLGATVPRRASAGYTMAVGLRTDLPDGQEVAVQRKAGGGWKTLASATPIRVSKGRARGYATLGAGRAQLRWTARRGDQTQVGKPATVRVRKARRWSTSARDTGPYCGGSSKSDLSFRVAAGGRELRDFRASVSTFCIGGLDPSTNYVKPSFARVKRVKVAPDGRFLVISTVSKTTAIVSGRLRRGRVTDGRVELSYPLCSGSRTFKARRR